MALVIAVSALKGGVGKSTVTLNLATCLHRDGHRVLVVDLDKQGTCKAWAAIASESGHPGPAVVALAGPALRRDLPSLAAGYDVVIVDTPPFAGPESKAAMLAADLIVIPTVAGPADAWALQDTIAVLDDVRALRPEIVAAVLLNRADNTRLTKAVREAAAGLGLPLLKAELRARVTFGEATLAGQGVVTYAPSSPAAREVEQMAAAVLAALRGNDGQADATDGQPHQAGANAPANATTANPSTGSRSASAREQRGADQLALGIDAASAELTARTKRTAKPRARAGSRAKGK